MRLNKGFTIVELLVVIFIIGVLIAIVLTSFPGNAEAGWLFNRTSKVVDVVEGLVAETAEVGVSQKAEAEATEANHQRLMKAVPVPRLETSQERKNLVRRLDVFNNENKISYIYLISFGKVMTFYTVKGKVSSVNSKLTTGEQIVPSEECKKDVSWDNESACYQTVESPQLDGSYGTNGNAIFFFTTEDVYVEWNGEYMLADQPLRLATPPALIRTIE